MKKPVDNYCGRVVHRFLTDSGLLKQRVVDQLPVKADFKAANGFFRNDISLLLEASEKNNKVQFDALASRLADVPVDGSKEGLSIADLFDRWMPQYIQTATELQQWPKYLAENHPDLYARLYPDGAKESSADPVGPIDISDLPSNDKSNSE